jgi:hypothetical protein
VAVDAAGQWHLAYATLRGPSCGIYYEAVGAGRNATKLSDLIPDGPGSETKIAVSDDGTVFVAWNRCYGDYCHGVSYASSRDGWVVHDLDEDVGCGGWWVDAVISGNGRTFMATSQVDGSIRICDLRSSTGTLLASVPRAAAPQLAVDANGLLHVAYDQAQRGGSFYSCKAGDGIAYAVEPDFAPVIVPIGHPGCKGFAFALRDDSVPCFFWRSANASAQSSGVHYGCLEQMVIVSTPADVPTNQANQGPMQMAFDAAGHVHVVREVDFDKPLYGRGSNDGRWTWEALPDSRDWQLAVGSDGAAGVISVAGAGFEWSGRLRFMSNIGAKGAGG